MQALLIPFWGVFAIVLGIYCFVHGYVSAGILLTVLGTDVLLTIVCLVKQWKTLGISALICFSLICFITTLEAAVKGDYVDMINACAYGTFYAAICILFIKWGEIRKLSPYLGILLFLAHACAAAGVIVIIIPSPWVDYPLPIISLLLSLLFILLFSTSLQEQKKIQQSIKLGK